MNYSYARTYMHVQVDCLNSLPMHEIPLPNCYATLISSLSPSKASLPQAEISDKLVTGNIHLSLLAIMLSILIKDYDRIDLSERRFNGTVIFCSHNWQRVVYT